MSVRPLALTACGAVTPVGLDAAQTCASLRAGIRRLGEHAWYACLTPDPDWDEEDPLIAGCVPSLDPDLDGRERLLALLQPALAEVLADGGVLRADLAGCALLLALPERDEATDALDLERTLLPALQERTGLDGFAAAELDRSGRTGVFTLLDRAAALLRERKVGRCLVGGVDTYLLESRLQRLDGDWRLRSQRAVDGFCPGEAAALLLVEDAATAAAAGRAPRALLGPTGFGEEPQTSRGELASTGRGLAAALAAAAGQEPCRWVLCDLNGESYRAHEWGVARFRLPQLLADPHCLQHPADQVGDVGAATGALLCAWVCEAFRRSYHADRRALLWAADDAGRRTALTLLRPAPDNREA